QRPTLLPPSMAHYPLTVVLPSGCRPRLLARERAWVERFRSHPRSSAVPLPFLLEPRVAVGFRRMRSVASRRMHAAAPSRRWLSLGGWQTSGTAQALATARGA